MDTQQFFQLGVPNSALAQLASKLSSQRQPWLEAALLEEDWDQLGDLLAAELIRVQSFWQGGMVDQAVATLEDAKVAWFAVLDPIESPFLPVVFFELSDLHARLIESRIELPIEVSPVIRCPSKVPASRLFEDGRIALADGKVLGAMALFFAARARWLSDTDLLPVCFKNLALVEDALSDCWRALRRFDRSLAALERAGSYPIRQDLTTRGCLANNRAVTLRLMGRPFEAMEWYHEAQRLWEEALVEEPDSEELHRWIGNLDSNQANTYAELGETHRALAQHRRAVSRKRLQYQNTLTPEAGARLARGLSNLSIALRQQFHFQDGLDAAFEAQQLLSSLMDSHPEFRYDLSKLEHNLGNAYSDKGGFLEALEAYRRAETWLESLQESGHPNLEFEIAFYQSAQAAALQRLGRSEQALKLLLQALPVLEAQANQPGEELAESWELLGTLYQEQEQYDRCLTYFEKALELWDEIKTRLPARLSRLVALQYQYGHSLTELGQLERGRAVLERAADNYRILVQEQGRLELREDHLTCLLQLAYILSQIDETQAEVRYREAIETSARTLNDSRELEARSDFAGLLLDQERYREVLEQWRSAKDLRSHPPTSVTARAAAMLDWYSSVAEFRLDPSLSRLERAWSTSAHLESVSGLAPLFLARSFQILSGLCLDLEDHTGADEAADRAWNWTRTASDLEPTIETLLCLAQISVSRSTAWLEFARPDLASLHARNALEPLGLCLAQDEISVSLLRICVEVLARISGTSSLDPDVAEEGWRHLLALGISCRPVAGMQTLKKLLSELASLLESWTSPANSRVLVRRFEAAWTETPGLGGLSMFDSRQLQDWLSKHATEVDDLIQQTHRLASRLSADQIGPASLELALDRLFDCKKWIIDQGLKLAFLDPLILGFPANVYGQPGYHFWNTQRQRIEANLKPRQPQP